MTDERETLTTTSFRDEVIRAVEAERQRLAGLLEDEIVDKINLLLSQTKVYEQTMNSDPQVRMVTSILGSLIRQLLQQVRDLSHNLHPTLLETLGLEPALESLVDQFTRTYGLKIRLHLIRLDERLPAPIELALFRFTQQQLENAVKHAHASTVFIQLQREADQLHFVWRDDGLHKNLSLIQSTNAYFEFLGVNLTSQITPTMDTEVVIRFTLPAISLLSNREIEVLRWVAQGLSNKQIAQQMNISPRTINFHLDNIYSKLGVNSRTEAVTYALRQGWIV